MLGRSLILLVVLLLPLTPAAADVVSIDASSEGLFVELVESSALRTVIEYRIGSFDRTPVDIGGVIYDAVSLRGESDIMALGLPRLPDVARSIVIPDDAEMEVRVLASHYIDIPGMRVAPAKGIITRDIDPATVPYSFDGFYETNRWYPSGLAYAREPYIMRDARGLVIVLNPFQYNPSLETLRVYDRVVIEVVPIGPGRTNVLKRRPAGGVDAEFRKIYERHFLNYESAERLRYSTVGEVGSMLIICYDDFMANMQPFVEWKRQMGIPCEMVGVTTAGASATEIRDYIRDYYDTTGVTFVLLVGDAAQIPTLSSSGGASDPSYSLVAGDDSYPDIFVGRFSAENAGQVDTQVLRSVEYEKLPQPLADWYHRGTGVASSQGPGDDGEYDDEHLDLIRYFLRDFTYTIVDQIYDPVANPTMVAAALNDGRGIVNYTGHGSLTAWSSSDFSVTHVNALVNDDMLPFIVSVACVNGAFTSSTTCFAEAWLRATNGGVPAGALATYMSSINQSWDPPMCAQDEIVYLLVNEEKRTFGGLCMNGSCQMIDEYGADGISMFKTWHVFGDPSVRVRTNTPTGLTVVHDENLDPMAEAFTVSVPGVEGALCALYAGGVLYGSALTNAEGDAAVDVVVGPPSGVDLTVTVTAFNRVPYFGTALVGEMYVPIIHAAPSYLDVAMEPGERRLETVYIENVGDTLSVLHYDLEIVDAPGPRDFTGSSVAASPTFYVPGETIDFTFSVYNGSTAGEWIRDVTLGFPTGTAVISCTDFEVSGRLLDWDGTTGGGAPIGWFGDATNVISPYETATATISISVDLGFAGDMDIAYTLEGDQHGGPPYSESGTVTLSPSDAPEVTLVVPNGGEVWGVGESHDITWDWSGTFDLVSISCSTDSGGNWVSVASSTENDGAFPWLVDVPVSSVCLMKVAALSGPAVEDVSDGLFSVYQPVTWLSAEPVSGDVLSGESDGVVLKFDATDLPEGDYYADIVIDSNGGGRLIVPVALHVQAAGVGDLPTVSVLYGNYPNPFNPQTRIAFALQTEGPARVTIYSPAGRLVRTLADRVFDAGPHEIPWDGTDEAGVSVASGVYLYRLEAAGRKLGGRMVLAR